ncbi:hypothetical protein AX774_g4842 [Zancudomyces culisetae]|uniref:Uncharacterized protein n=1 Tax=Zancudomyces culisetae TaxID=1213189 RepID=A0A1R1PL87_ZANCU|nr:hypothetical protein AX774_g4842 [Zancudomyces culisetae]|eukprot:OMH81693.1 hypothetical protein AX774_g4842 [Zancudomyces culisetae]
MQGSEYEFNFSPDSNNCRTQYVSMQQTHNGNPANPNTRQLVPNVKTPISNNNITLESTKNVFSLHPAGDNTGVTGTGFMNCSSKSTMVNHNLGKREPTMDYLGGGDQVLYNDNVQTPDNFSGTGIDFENTGGNGYMVGSDHKTECVKDNNVFIPLNFSKLCVREGGYVFKNYGVPIHELGSGTGGVSYKPDKVPLGRIANWKNLPPHESNTDYRGSTRR